MLDALDCRGPGRTGGPDRVRVVGLRLLEAVGRSAASGLPVQPPPRQPGRLLPQGTGPNPWRVRPPQA